MFVCTDISNANIKLGLFRGGESSGEKGQDQSIPQLFEAQAARTPDAVAFACPSAGSESSQEKQITYRELNSRANQLAHYLRTLSVGPETLVGICMERSLEMVVGLLGILKAGGAYVPLDPTYPRERLAFMLEDAQVPVLLTQQRLAEGLPRHQARLIRLDTDWETIAQESIENPVSGVTTDNLAYVVYTSGSTGRPKGVLGLHRGTINRFEWMWRTYPFEAGEVCCQKTSLSFVDSVWEIFGPLLQGIPTVVIPDEMSKDPRRLVQALADHRVTRIVLVPSLLRAILDMDIDIQSRLSRLKYWVSSGETLTMDLLRCFQERLPESILLNLYGSSEVSADATWHDTSTGEILSSVPIGRPIANIRAHILDFHLQPVPVGVQGELYLGGVGLARGYLDRPDLTAERFIPDPLSDKPGACLYKTGDLTRYLPDGNIEFLGRVDHQVKIRGFRIELGEIETVIGQHPAVRETVVLAREDVPGQKHLVAYVVPNQGQTLTINDLRSFLQTKLPDHMLPSALVMLEALPLTPNGKIDRSALPAPGTARPQLEEEYVAPRSPVEEVLADIWADVLGLERVGIHDNFFVLGGHSLLATQLASRLRDAFQVELSLRSLFEAPTVAGIAQYIESDAVTRFDTPPIAPVSRDRDLPLSFAQQRLWFLDQLQPGSSAYNIPTAVRLTGPLNVAALTQSLGEIVLRHEALRTTFAMVADQPVQVIAPTMTVGLPVVDLQHLPEMEQEAEAQRLTTEEARRPFDLAQGPLLRATLLRLDTEEQVLLLTMHHIVSDGWSMDVLFRELAMLYEAYTTGAPSPLPELSIQYTDFAIWQQEWLQGEVLEAQLAYWKEQLGGELPVLQLPTDRPRPPIQTFRGATHSFVLPKLLTKALETLSHEEETTLFMTLLAAFKVLLYRYAGQTDILIGAPIAGRNRSEMEGLIGFFVNTLVLRTDLSGNPTFRELLGRVRETALGAYANQDIPFERLVEELQPERDLSRQPLFQVMFALQETLVEALKLPGLTMRPMEVESGTALFDLSLDVEENEQGLASLWEYNADLFDATRITRMARHFQTLLEGIVAHPDQRLSELPLLTASERHQILVEWNNTGGDYPRDACIHELFEAQVERTPGAIAAVLEGEELTYRELNRRANQLAHYLQGLGVGVEVLVGIYMERSLEMVVGLLAILKAGGAYVPLDPAFPKERLAFMLQDIQVSVVLTQQRLVEILHFAENDVVCGAKLICLDTDWQAIASASAENLVNRTTAENLAYVIYTSGTTGKPKGVMIQHDSVVGFVETAIAEYALEPGDRVLQFASLSFDTAGEEIYPCLARGATLVLRTDSMLASASKFWQKCRDWALTVLNLPTAYWHELIASFSANEELLLPQSLRLVIIGGEKALPEPLQTWQEYVGNRMRLVNSYGLTEATMVTTLCDLSALVEVPSQNDKASTTLREVPIGYPICNAQTYILDRYLQPVPIGVPGELHIGGIGLARGYFKRIELTAERFIPNPFSDESGARLYKTGDLVCYQPDGNIELLGRRDHQVKVRGFRIELEEIEAVLGQHPAVHESVVLDREDKPGHKYLVAYAVPSTLPGGTEQSPGEQGHLTRNLQSDLRDFLKEELPYYMVPSTFVFLAALPLTVHGKIDRRALPVPDTLGFEMEKVYVAPRNPVEEVLTGIWADVLGLERVGVHDNFFELRGHSLLAAQLIFRVRRVFKLELPLHSVFKTPTVAGLAETLVKYESVPGQVATIARLRQRINQMSADEIQALILEKKEARAMRK